MSLSASNGSIDVFYIPEKDLNNPKGKELKTKFFKDKVFYFTEVSQLSFAKLFQLSSLIAPNL